MSYNGRKGKYVIKVFNINMKLNCMFQTYIQDTQTHTQVITICILYILILTIRSSCDRKKGRELMKL